MRVSLFWLWKKSKKNSVVRLYRRAYICDTIYVYYHLFQCEDGFESLAARNNRSTSPFHTLNLLVMQASHLMQWGSSLEPSNRSSSWWTVWLPESWPLIGGYPIYCSCSSRQFSIRDVLLVQIINLIRDAASSLLSGVSYTCYSIHIQLLVTSR